MEDTNILDYKFLKLSLDMSIVQKFYSKEVIRWVLLWLWLLKYNASKHWQVSILQTCFSSYGAYVPMLYLDCILSLALKEA